MTHRIAGICLVLVAVAMMLVLSWRGWCEPMVDFGRELYVPWQLAEGKALYRDIAYFNGPLSPYFNAAVFKLMGISLLTLAMVNAVILSGMLVLLHRICAKLSDESLATAICTCVVPILCIAQPGPVGNYNFITPYSHEMTHGLLLALGAIACLILPSRKVGWDLLCGMLCGLTILTKPEIALATVLTVLAWAAIDRQWMSLVRMAAGMIAFPLLAAIVLGADAFLAYRAMVDSRLLSLPFYQLTRGTYDLAGSLTRLLAACGAWVLLAVVGMRFHRVFRLPEWSGGVAVFVCITAVYLLDLVNWRSAGLPLIVTSLLIVAQTLSLKSQPASAGGGSLPRGMSVFALAALLLLGKIALNVTLSNYGFVLALPALVVTAIAGARWIGKYPVIGALAGLALVHGILSVNQWKSKTVAIGRGADRFHIPEDRAGALELLCCVEMLPRGATCVIIPQGAMLNYLSRRETGSPWIVLMPPEVLMFGDARIAQSFDASPSDYLVLAATDLREYGVQSFPQYAPQTAAVVDRRYAVWGSGTGWKLLKRQSP